MFNWVWSLLYLISKTLFRLIDGLIQCANYLCGIDPIKVNGEEVDFLQYILSSDQVGFAFRVSALLGIIVIVVFSIIAILRTLAKDKSEGTPTQIVGKAIKSILSFLFIPVIMIVVTGAGNVFMKAMYEATLQGGSSLGDFLFKAFAMESGVSEFAVDEFLANPDLDWRNTDDVWGLMNLADFEFIFSYIAGFVILGAVGMSMMYFVGRILSIIILFIAAPFSIGSSVLDDGARFKLWREQILIKFITGYGMMIAINVFAMLCLLVMNPTLVFFEKGSFVDYLTKLLIIAGGGVALKQSMALIGNLISSGAGSNELRDSAISGGLGGLATGVMSKVPGAGMARAVGNSIKQEMAGSAAQKILPAWAQRSYAGKGKSGGIGSQDSGGRNNNNNQNDEGSGSHNSNMPSKNNNNKDFAKNAIGGFDNNNRSNSNRNNDNNNNNNRNGGNRFDSNNQNNNQPKNNTVNNFINNAINFDDKKSQKKEEGYDDFYEDGGKK